MKEFMIYLTATNVIIIEARKYVYSDGSLDLYIDGDLVASFNTDNILGIVEVR